MIYVIIKSGRQCSSAQKRICDVSELKQWMIGIRSYDCSRQSLMKLTPVNCINVCQLVFVVVPEMNAVSTLCNFQAI